MAFLLLPGCIIADEPSELTIMNDSDFDILELRLAPVDSAAWGPNELGSDPLFPDEAVTLGGIPCDTYDLLIVDDLGAECVLEDISLCFGTEEVTRITNSRLAFCPFRR